MRTLGRAWRLWMLALCACSIVAQPALAQPASQTIKLIFPLAPGSNGDGLARLLADRLQTRLGQPVVVENRAGGASRVGLTNVKNAAPDGTTLLVTQMGPMTLFPSVYKTLDYDPATDFAPVSQIARFDFALAVSEQVPAKTPAELIAWLKANPDKATIGAPGSGGLPHFFGMMIGRAAGVAMTHVPYKGTAPAISDLLGNQIPMMLALASDFAELQRSGKVRVIATSDSERSSGMPDVPTFKESGLDLVGTGWYGVYAPAGTPPAIVARLNTEIVAIMTSPDIRERVTALALRPTGTSAEELRAIQQADLAKWAPIVKASGFVID